MIQLMQNSLACVGISCVSGNWASGNRASGNMVVETALVKTTLVETALHKMNSLYQIRSKMLHSTKVIILVKKNRERCGLTGFRTYDLHIRNDYFRALQHFSANLV